MKKIIIICVICIYGVSFAQNQTKKWNSVTKRYEYFDSRGSLIGYEKYNNILKQWEYFDSKLKNKYENYNKDSDDFYEDLNKQQDDVINNLLLQKSRQQNQTYSSPQTNKSPAELNNIVDGSKKNLLERWFYSIVNIYKIEQYETLDGKNVLLNTQTVNNYKLYIDQNVLSFLINDKPAFKKNIVLLNYLPPEKGYLFKDEANHYVFITEKYDKVTLYSGKNISVYYLGSK